MVRNAPSETRTKATPPKDVIVWARKGGFGGWPANHGVWSWGDEILVGFAAAHFKHIPGAHAIDPDKPSVSSLGRSLDGGLSWTTETFSPQGGAAAVPPEGIDFTHPGFAMTLRGGSFSFSYDRGRTWRGPVPFPAFGLSHLAARTDYLVNGPRDCTAFLSAAKPNGKEGRPFCVRTQDGGKTWRFLSWISPEYPGYAIMPASLRLEDGRILCAVRVQSEGRAWIPLFASDDDGSTWQHLTDVTEIPGGNSNPPAMIRLRDGRICLTYGYRHPPYGFRARLSRDRGVTWGRELVLRRNGGCWDLGYTRTVQRPDGRIVTVYYYNDAQDRERYIAATIWDPDPVAPERRLENPVVRLAAGAKSARIRLETDVQATCKCAGEPDVPYDDMPFTFSETGGVRHSTVVEDLKDGEVRRVFVKARDRDGNANWDDAEFTLAVTDPAKPPFRAELEAANAELTAPMAFRTDEPAAGARYVATPEAEKGAAAFRFTAPRDGQYVVWARVFGLSYSEDSFHVSVDGGEEDIFDIAEAGTAGRWHWCPVNGRGGRFALALNPRRFPLSAGAHTLVFRGREKNARLQRLVVTDDPYFRPAD